VTRYTRWPRPEAGYILTKKLNQMNHPSLSQILDVIEEVYSQGEADRRERLAKIELLGDHRRFLVGRMGSTGSTWLAKLLNSHPDVLCTHEQVLSKIHPRESYGVTDVIDLMRDIAWNTQHYAYQAAGDVGSVWLGLLLISRDKFTTALLVRHPARLINTRLKIFPTDQSFTTIEPETTIAIQRLWDINLAKLDMMDQIFLHDLFTFVSQVRAVDQLDLIIRIEDLLDPDYCHEVLYGLTGVRYEADLVARALTNKVNRRTSEGNTVREIVNGLTPQQREWYRLFLDDVAPRFGYELDTDVTLVTSSAVGG
jgi:hypothetical protein